jgi:hypothetical protein
VSAPIFFFDKNCGTRVPEALDRLRIRTFHIATPKRKAGLRARNAEEPLFEPDTPDDVWLPIVGQQQWVVVSHDQKFHKPGFESELNAIKQYGVGCFYLWGASVVPYEKARCFLKAYENILRVVQTTPRPFIFSIDKNSRLTRIL